MHLKWNRGERNNVNLKYLYNHIYLHYKSRSSTVTDKQSVSLNITSVHLSDFADFANIFIRERSKQSTSELSLMVTDEMVYTTVNFFNKFQMFAQKLHSPYFLNLILVSLRVVFFF